MTLSTSLPAAFPRTGLVKTATIEKLKRTEHLSVRGVRRTVNEQYSQDQNPEICFRHICSLEDSPVFIPNFRDGNEDVLIQEIGDEHLRLRRHRRWFNTIRKAGLIPFLKDWNGDGELWLCGRIKDWEAFGLRSPVAEDFSGNV